jgi:large subunit ribosomal protein L4
MVVDDLKVKEPKTRLMAEALSKLTGDASTLLLLPNKDEQYEMISISARNLPAVKTIQANYLNIRDLLGYDKVILPLAALEVIEGYLG